MPGVLIIGGGPAGSLAAMLLARAGWHVTLVEQHTFPRDKVCGECLSALGFEVLQRHGAAALPAEPVRLDRTIIHAAGGASATIQLPRPMWGISRHVLDAHLLELARSAGAEIRQPARCETIAKCASVRDLSTNQVERVAADVVLRADGKAPADRGTGDFGIKTHFGNVDGPRDAIELFGVVGSYGGLAAIEGGRWNAAFSVPVDRLRAHRGDVDALFAEMVTENAALSRRLKVAKRCGRWLASPLPRFGVSDEWQQDVIPIGNAAAAIEPIGGEGMGLALRSAELAAAALIKSVVQGREIDLDGLRRDYRRLWRVRSVSCRSLAVAVSNASLAARVTSLIDGCEGLTSIALSLIGK